MIPSLRQRLRLRLASLAAVLFSIAAEAAEKRQRLLEAFRVLWFNTIFDLNCRQLCCLPAALPQGK